MKNRRYGVTHFQLYWSDVNTSFIFRRVDAGTTNEHTILSGYSEKDAIKYFNDKVSFYCEVVGIEESDMRCG